MLTTKYAEETYFIFEFLSYALFIAELFDCDCYWIALSDYVSLYILYRLTYFLTNFRRWIWCTLPSPDII